MQHSFDPESSHSLVSRIAGSGANIIGPWRQHTSSWRQQPPCWDGHVSARKWATLLALGRKCDVRMGKGIRGIFVLDSAHWSIILHITHCIQQHENCKYSAHFQQFKGTVGVISSDSSLENGLIDSQRIHVFLFLSFIFNHGLSMKAEIETFRYRKIFNVIYQILLIGKYDPSFKEGSLEIRTTVPYFQLI